LCLPLWILLLLILILFLYTTLFRSLRVISNCLDICVFPLYPKSSSTVFPRNLATSSAVLRFSSPVNVARIILTGLENLKKAEDRSEEHTTELQSRFDLVCRLLLEKK